MSANHGGNTIDKFTTLIQSIGPTYVKGVNSRVNEATKNTYTRKRLQGGRSMEDLITATTTIKDRLFTKHSKTFERVNPDVEIDYPNPQTGVDWTAHWSIAIVKLVYNEFEKIFNADTSKYKSSYIAHKFKDVMQQKYQDCWTEFCNELDSEDWAQPNAQLMENTEENTLAPYSIPAGVNEYPYGLFGKQATSFLCPEPTGGRFTTFQHLDPTSAAVNGKWQPLVQNYNADFSGGGTGIDMMTAFLNQYHQLRFEKLPKHAEHGEKATMPHVIFTSLWGLGLYDHVLLKNQDVFRGVGISSGQDPAYDKPAYMRIPLDWASELDYAALYPTGASLAASDEGAQGGGTGTTAIDLGNNTTARIGLAGPRFYWITGEYVRFLYHRDKFFSPTPFMRPHRMPFKRVQVITLTNQTIFRSRRRLGLLTPLIDVDESVVARPANTLA